MKIERHLTSQRVPSSETILESQHQRPVPLEGRMYVETTQNPRNPLGEIVPLLEGIQRHLVQLVVDNMTLKMNISIDRTTDSLLISALTDAPVAIVKIKECRI